eukprot:1147176-Pelagomonas_calceolata.AAC.1
MSKPVLGHGDFNTKVGKRILRANELSWFALDQDLVFEQTPGKACHRHIALEYFALWTRRLQEAKIGISAHDAVTCKCPTAVVVLCFLFNGVWTFVDALRFIASPTSMEPAQQGFHVYEEKKGREGVPMDVPPFYGDVLYIDQ